MPEDRQRCFTLPYHPNRAKATAPTPFLLRSFRQTVRPCWPCERPQPTGCHSPRTSTGPDGVKSYPQAIVVSGSRRDSPRIGPRMHFAKVASLACATSSLKWAASATTRAKRRPTSFLTFRNHVDRVHGGGKSLK